MKNILVLFLILTSLAVNAQNAGNIWYFGDKAGLDFNTAPPTPLTNSAMTTSEGCAAIADPITGALLFYTDGITVWTKTHVPMPGCLLTPLKGDFSSTQSAVIVPKPGFSNIYYIFTTPSTVGAFSFPAFTSLAYTIVDMSLNGGNGDITNVNTIVLDTTTEKIAVVGNCAGTEYWIVGHKWDCDSFYAFKLTSAGLAPPVKTKIGLVHSDPTGSTGNAESIGYMKFSGDGSKLALVNYKDANFMQLFDFNFATGVMSNPTTDVFGPNPASFGSGLYGLSFSPNSTKLYISHFGDGFSNDSSIVYQYDVTLGTSAAILASRTIVAWSLTDGYSALQIGPNGKLYLSHDANIAQTLHVFNNPNNAGLGSGFVANAQTLGTGTCVFGLTAMVENFLSSGGSPSTLSYPNCSVTQTLSFPTQYGGGSSTYSWNFGDPASGTNNLSTVANPSHTFSASGTFIVTLTTVSPCGTDVITKTITVNAVNVVKVNITDTTICKPHDAILLKASNCASYIWTFDTTLSCNICPQPVAKPWVSSIYTVEGTDANGCKSTRTVSIKVVPLKVKFASLDSTCLNNANIAFTNLTTGGNPTWTWNFGDSVTQIGGSLINHNYLYSSIFNISLIAFDTLGCIDTFSKKIFIDEPAFNYFSVSDSIICLGEPIQFVDSISQYAQFFKYDFNDFSNSINIHHPIHLYNTVGTYTVTLTSKNPFCISIPFSKKIEVVPVPNVNIGPDSTFCPELNVNPLLGNNNINFPGSTYLWSTGQTTQSINTAGANTYWLQVNLNGCINSDTMELKRDCYLNIPNAFAPNSTNEINAYFMPRQLLSSGVNSFAMKIFNRWGNEVFNTTNITGKGWDGKLGGANQPMGVYVYHIDVVFKNGTVKKYTGNVTLIR
jgi:gliding motility-associated-like protein